MLKILFATSLLLCPIVSSAAVVSSQELIINASIYDGKIIEYEGEVIGEVMRRGSHSWINVYDGNTAIGVWVLSEHAQKIKLSGKYCQIGDRIKVRGVFNRRCLEHGGDLDIHAQQIQVTELGRKIEEEIPPVKKKVAWGFGIILGLVWILHLYRKHWNRN
ncbi:MAG: DNA-binding protein [Candidatus Omnitrophica bacterium]|nr:DNA-binding protein [Candidatus Omnitrophota bacterium]